MKPFGFLDEIHICYLEKFNEQNLKIKHFIMFHCYCYSKDGSIGLKGLILELIFEYVFYFNSHPLEKFSGPQSISTP